MYFSSSTSLIRISLPKSNHKSCPISASIHAKDFQFKGNNIYWRYYMMLFYFNFCKPEKSKLVSFSFFTAVFTNDKLIASIKFCKNEIKAYFIKEPNQ